MINLDAMTEEELAEAAIAFEHLAMYANRKKLAMSWRKKGLVQNAASHENTCDAIYAKLPRPYRW